MAKGSKVEDFFLFCEDFYYRAAFLISRHADVFKFVCVSLSLSLSVCMFCFCLLLLLFATKFYSPFTAIKLNLIYSRKISEAPLWRSRRTSPRFFARARMFPFSY